MTLNGSSTLLEPFHSGESVDIPELNMRIKLKEGKTLRNWVEKYVESNPLLRKKLEVYL